MVIILNKSSKHRNLNNNQKESSEQAQEKNTKPQNDQTSFHVPDTLDIRVTIAEEYLPILGKKIKNYFLEKNKHRIEDTKNGKIHISSINGCVRQSMIQEQYAEQLSDYTIWELCNFMDGLDSEKIIVKILDHGRSNIDESGEFQKDIIFDNFLAHPDYIDDETGFIFELKSTNKIKPFILSDDTMKVYLRQIIYYLVLEGLEKGRVLARYNLPYFPEYVGKDVDAATGVEESLYKLRFHKDSGQFPFFACDLEIKMDAASRHRIKKALTDIIKPIYLAGDITKVPILDDRDKNWKCQAYCKCKDICYTIPDLQTDQQARYVLLNKHIDNSIDKVRRYGKRKDINVDIST
jgi:hypothetical protein